MTHVSQLSRLALTLVPIAAMALSAVGCESTVYGDDGLPVCEEYTGDGCERGEERTCSFEDEIGGKGYGTDHCVADEEDACETHWEYGCNTPLVLSFDGAEPELLADELHAFDVNGRASQVTDWPSAKTPWLALDRDGSGAIESGSELFGSMSPLENSARAENGFIALRALDANGDGHITAEDPGFASLLVWADRDGNRLSGANELKGVTAWEIVSIDLAYTSESRCDARNNCGVERAPFQYRDAAGTLRTGTVIDIRLPAQ